MSNNGMIPVRVAVRMRPLSKKELDEGCEKIVEVLDDTQIYIESTKNAFTYDYAFAENTNQAEMYEKSVKNLIPQLFQGYNVTVLAYGQTGSGKTHSMGTTNSSNTPTDLEGVIPRAIRDIFDILANDTDHSFVVRVSFIELYKEQLFDLLSSKSCKKEECVLDLREDPRLGIKIVNLTETPVSSLCETMEQLEIGSAKRVTAATAMNNVSSRSHAIFTVHIERAKKCDAKDILMAKFHLVDLAGSERQKKTKATGERFKEGIDINKGLLALGNVIAALGEDSQMSGFKHIPYRDSKLTRLLQDSLGGNSHTLMITCASPSDSNLDETLSTLRYADRARKIKNKPIVNRDGKEAELNRLRAEIASLKQRVGGVSGGGNNEQTLTELAEVKAQNKRIKLENSELTSALMAVQDELAHLNERVLLADSVNEKLKTKLTELTAEFKCKMSETENYTEVLSKIQEVVDTQKSAEKKLVEHDMSRFESSSSSTFNIDDGDVDEEGEEDCSDKENDENVTAHALRQNGLATKLQSLNKLLAQKEQLATAMNNNEERFTEMKRKYEESIKTMEIEMEKLMKEKDELTQHQRNDPSNKIAEQRRKRIQELEGTMQEMKKKITEQQKAIKLNEKDKVKMSKLTQEIVQMKQQKVKLIRQMKEDAEQVRVWKQQKERELMRVKQVERKNQVKIAKMENLHLKQKNVLKRKMEEVAAMNAKLKAIVEKQKTVQGQKVGSGLAGAGERVRAYIQDEMDVIVGYKEAVQARENLFKERTSFKSQLNVVRQELRSTLGPVERQELDKKVANLTSEIEDRSAGIANLQKHIADLDKVKDTAGTRWDSLQTMTEARIAMEYLFEKASESLATNAILKTDNTELQTQYDEATKTLNELEAEMSKMKALHEDEVVRASREHEEKVLFLLRQLPGFREGEHASDIEERLKLQESEIKKMSQLNEVLIKMKEENDQLKRELEGKAFLKPVAPKIKKSFKKIEYMDESLTEDEEVDSDNEDDPEWRNTPLFARIRNLKKQSMPTTMNSSVNLTKRKLDTDTIGDEEDDDTPPLNSRKRISKGNGCKCRRKCNTKSCSCRKNENTCASDICGCDSDICINRTALADITNNTTANTISILNGDSFNITEIKEEEEGNNSPVKRKRITMDHRGGTAISYTPSPVKKEPYFKSPSIP